MSVYVIAEAGVNHNGSIELARALVDAACLAGADAVKFQTFRAAEIVSRNAAKAEYQKANTDAAQTQLEMLRQLELTKDDHRTLKQYACAKGIEFLSTPFDRESLDFLVTELAMQKVKIASGEITNAPLLLSIAKSGRKLILSSGMASLGEVEAALAVLAFGMTNGSSYPTSNECLMAAYASPRGRKLLEERVTLLHCTTEYPAPIDEVNLKAIDTLRSAFGLPVGYSDHTSGIHVPIAAVARGAVLIEKHFTLDKSLSGPDHKASLEPKELLAMVEAIRDVERALGSGVKAPAAGEAPNRLIARRSLTAARDIVEGEMFTVDNLVCKRPGSGVSPMRYWSVLGTPVGRSYVADELIDL